MQRVERICHICGALVGAKESCPTCTEAYKHPRDVATMTTVERLAEFDLLNDVLEFDLDLLHKRIEELLGRPVWTHELADIDSIRREIASGDRATMTAILEKIPAAKRIIVSL